MLVLLEGVDGTGKTTLLKELLDRGFCCKRTFRHDNNDARPFYKCSHSSEIVVLDRSFISDMVYRMVDNLWAEDLSMHDAAEVLDGDVKIIHCVNSNHYEDAMKRGEDNITDKTLSDKIAFIYEIFMTYFNKYTNAKVFKYDYHCNTVDDVIDFIKEVKNG